jgi:hypothetical protein
MQDGVERQLPSLLSHGAFLAISRAFHLLPSIGYFKITYMHPTAKHSC